METRIYEINNWLTDKYIRSPGDRILLKPVKQDEWYVYCDVYMYQSESGKNNMLTDKKVKIDRKTFTVWENFEGRWQSHYRLE